MHRILIALVNIPGSLELLSSLNIGVALPVARAWALARAAPARSEPETPETRPGSVACNWKAGRFS